MAADATSVRIPELIYRNLEEVVGRDELDAKIAQKKTLVAYIGFAPTGQIHAGYLVPCMKIRDLTLAGCNVVVMIADIHAMMDERKTPPELVKARSEYYIRTLRRLLEILVADISHVIFTIGSKFQSTADYNMAVLELTSRVPINAALKAGTEVVKQTKHPMLGSAMYPLMQATDEQFVGQAALGVPVDIELGGIDQRKIFMFSKDWSDSKLTYLMNPIISLTKVGKMSASDVNGKIAFMDTREMITDKIKRAFCCNGDPDCGIMKLMKCVFFPLLSFIDVHLDNDIDKRYTDYDAFESDFRQGVFLAPHLKSTLIDLLVDIVDRMRLFLMSEDMVALTRSAYPN